MSLGGRAGRMGPAILAETGRAHACLTRRAARRSAAPRGWAARMTRCGAARPAPARSRTARSTASRWANVSPSPSISRSSSSSVIDGRVQGEHLLQDRGLDDRVLASAVPADLAAVVHGCLPKASRQRFSSPRRLLSRGGCLLLPAPIAPSWPRSRAVEVLGRAADLLRAGQLASPPQSASTLTW